MCVGQFGAVRGEIFYTATSHVCGTLGIVFLGVQIPNLRNCLDVYRLLCRHLFKEMFSGEPSSETGKMT